MNKRYKHLETKPSTQPMDKAILALLTLISCFGLVMIYSATIENPIRGSYHYLYKQLIALSISIVLMFSIAWFFPKITKAHLKKIAYVLISIAIVSLIAVEFYGYGTKGSVRWLGFNGFSVQPSEFIKIAVVLYIAYQTEHFHSQLSCTLTKSWWKSATIRNYLLSIIIPLIVIFSFLALQPDYGTIMLIALVSFLMICFWLLMLGRMRSVIIPLIGLVMLGIIGAWATIQSTTYIGKRVAIFLNPENDPSGHGYQIIQSLVYYARGGLTGQGLGNAAGYLPEQHNDFILALVGEELGFFGVIGIVLLLLMLITRIFSLARHTSQHHYIFYTMYIYGIGLLIGIQFLLSVLITLNYFPITGLTLPFVSYGGSSLVSLYVAMGILFYIQRNLPLEPKQQTQPR